MTSYAIVAIPSRDDYIWNISSEKVPHLTMLYLDSNLENLNEVLEFISHVANTSLRKFYLDVNERGLLGKDSADVLFLEGYDLKMLKEFRRYLLTNDDIFKAYNSVEQFPKWTPHVTLGYPETPAKPDKRDYPGVHSIAFDRIALWTGEYEGVEIPLTRHSPEAFAMATARGEAYLEHYGVKGMKWGVIRKEASKLVLPSDDAVQASIARGKAKLGGVHTLSNKELQNLIKRMDLEVKFKDLKDVQHNQSLIGKGAKWAGKVFTDILVGVTISWLRRPGRGAPTAGAPTSADAFIGRPAIGGSPVRRAIGS